MNIFGFLIVGGGMVMRLVRGDGLVLDGCDRGNRLMGVINRK